MTVSESTQNAARGLDVERLLPDGCQLVGGEWVAGRGGGTIEVLNPATGEPLARVPRSGEADVSDASARSVTADLSAIGGSAALALQRVDDATFRGSASLAPSTPEGVGTIALNAIPWAEVWIDGEKVGETPIGNLPVAVGPHEIIFRHPDLGEQRQAVVVTLATPARVTIDLRKK